MANRELVAALESRLVNAWPAFEVEWADGWLLRFAQGYSKRANAATPIVPGATLDEPLVRAVEAAFAARGLPPAFRLTGLDDPGAERVLHDLGYTDYDPSLALVAPLATKPARDPAVRLEPVPKPRWIAAAAAAQVVGKTDATVLGAIVRRIRQPAAFATVSLDGQDAAWGFAVCERGFVGLYDIVVAPDLRGLGLGRRLVATLLAWGREAGAARAYLQMRESNAVAAALYRSLGFDVAYRYTHRVQPTALRRGQGDDDVVTAAPADLPAGGLRSRS